MQKDPQIYVTKPFLPELDDFIPYLKEIWANGILTNAGPFHHRLEEALSERLGASVILYNNGTFALAAALTALDLKGEVITTPFSFVATAHVAAWLGLSPVFADIDPVTLNLDPAKVEAAITSRTAAILPVHCFGRPCDLDGLARVATDHNLPLVYDAAHTFGVDSGGCPLAAFGDLSVLSFHATKVFHTFEGGAVVCRDDSLRPRLEEFRNFGIIDEVTVRSVGLNGKMNELCAAMGLWHLDRLAEAIEARGAVDRLYRERLAGVASIDCHGWPDNCSPNYSYFPILVRPEYPLTRDELYAKLKSKNIHARRYFYPLISELSMYRALPSAAADNLPHASAVAGQVLCLPAYPGLAAKEVEAISAVIAEG